MFPKYKNAILSVLYGFLHTPKGIVRHFLVVVIFVPSRETHVEIGLYMRKIWGKHDNILLVWTVTYCLVGNKQDATLIVYKMREVCNNSILA